MRWMDHGFGGEPVVEPGAVALWAGEALIEVEIRVTAEPADEVEIPEPCPAR